MVNKTVKVLADASVWYAVKSICRRKGDLKKTVEEALKLYIDILSGRIPENSPAADPELPDASGAMYVHLRIDGNLWEQFRNGLRRGEVSVAFNEALKLYLGRLWGTLVFREDWVVGIRAELRRSVVNVAFEDFAENARYLPLEGEFGKPVLNVILRRLGRPSAVLSWPDLEPVNEEPEEAFSKGGVLVFVRDGMQFALSKTFFGPSSLSI